MAAKTMRSVVVLMGGPLTMFSKKVAVLEREIVKGLNGERV